MPRTKERPHSARKIIREKSSGRGAHRADLLSASRAWRKVVRVTRPERVVLAFAPPGILVLPPSAETTTARFSSESSGLHGLCFRSSSSAAACRLCRLRTGTGREAKKLLFFATRISVLGQNYKKAACGHWAMHHVSHKVCPRRGRFAKHHVVLIFLRRAPTPELVIAIAEWPCVSLSESSCMFNVAAPPPQGLERGTKHNPCDMEGEHKCFSAARLL